MLLKKKYFKPRGELVVDEVYIMRNLYVKTAFKMIFVPPALSRIF